MADEGKGTGVRFQDIADRLTAAGMGQDEARVFLHLSTQGGRPASAVARALGLSRAAVYRALARLAERDFVRSTNDHPARFEATPLEHVFDELLVLERARVEDLERLRGDLVAAASALGQTPTTPPPERILRVLRGRQDIYVIVELMIREAKESLYLVSTHGPGLSVGARMGAWNHAMERVEGGLRVRCAVRPTQQSRAMLAESALRDGLEVREVVSGEGPFQLLVADGRDTLLWVLHDPSDRLDAAKDAAMWSNDPAFAAAQLRLFEALWDDARPL